jgi:hypothetical protein
MDTTTNWPRSGPLWLLAYALLGVLATACGVARSASNATPTLISQPTPDRTVDAVVRGLVTLPPLGTGVPGTPGTAVATPRGGSPTQATAPLVVTPHLAPAAATATPEPRGTAAAAPRLASPTLAPTRAPATLARTAAPPTHTAPAVAPEPTRAVAPTAAPAPTRVVAPTAAPAAPRAAPTAVRPAPTAAPLPTFGRGARAS